jgi:hypothetical protein
VLRKLVSPAGFALALLFFLLPFIAASCDGGDAGSINASYSGFDLATGAQPTITASGQFAQSGGATDLSSILDLGVGALAIITAVLLMAGLAITLFAPVRLQLFATLGTVVTAGALLIWTEAAAMSHLRDLVRKVIQTQVPGVTEGMDAALDDAIGTRVGFWLALAALALVLLTNLAIAVRNWVRQ